MAGSEQVIGQTEKINTPAIQTTAGTALAANPRRTRWSIQNCDTDPLFVRLGGTASATEFHVVLQGGTGADDGKGGIYEQAEGSIFTGLISVAGTTPRFVVMEM